MALACDFHTETQCLEDFAKWIIKDTAVNKAMKIINIAGDYVTAGQTFTKLQHQAKIDEIFTALEGITTPVLFCQGNHDGEWENSYNPAYIAQIPTDAEIRRWVYDRAYNRLTTTDKANFHFPNDNPTALYYYFDMPAYKVRHITLNEYEFPTVLRADGSIS